MAGTDLAAPSLPWRAASRLTIALVGTASKIFLTLACTTNVVGLDGFTRLLDERRDVAKRDRGLLTGMDLDPDASAI
jgi:monolysocardiolipin acyltransferase